MEYKIYTDGACSGNPGPGGWAAIILNNNNNNKKTLIGSCKNTTNNIMELKALIEALKYLIKHNDINKKINVYIYSDSKYIVDGINKWLINWKKNNWRNSEKKIIKNLNLWQEIDILLNKINYSIIWVKGHDEDEYNNEVDQLARKAIKKTLDSTKSTI